MFYLEINTQREKHFDADLGPGRFCKIARLYILKDQLKEIVAYTFSVKGEGVVTCSRENGLF